MKNNVHGALLIILQNGKKNPECKKVRHTRKYKLLIVLSAKNVHHITATIMHKVSSTKYSERDTSDSLCK